MMTLKQLSDDNVKLLELCKIQWGEVDSLDCITTRFDGVLYISINASIEHQGFDCFEEICMSITGSIWSQDITCSYPVKKDVFNWLQENVEPWYNPNHIIIEWQFGVGTKCNPFPYKNLPIGHWKNDISEYIWQGDTEGKIDFCDDEEEWHGTWQIKSQFEPIEW